ncbi:MAG TPA: RDD family protein [Frankiaceae bacterium]|nr:RDD family protein [Frankiaceae bacterium]
MGTPTNRPATSTDPGSTVTGSAGTAATGTAPAGSDPGGIAPLLIPPDLRPYQGRPAGVVSRTLACAIDLGIVCLALVAIYLGGQGLRFLASPSGFHFRSAPRGLALVVAAVLMVGYLAGSWAIGGRTYGDHVLALRVVYRTDARIHPVRALARALVCVGFPLGLFWSGLSPTRRSVADILLRTSVRYDWESVQGSVPPPRSPGPAG